MLDGTEKAMCVACRFLLPSLIPRSLCRDDVIANTLFWDLDRDLMSNSLLLSTELCLDTGRPYLFELLILALTLIGWPGLKGFSSSLMNSLIILIFFFLTSVTVLLLIFTLILGTGACVCALFRFFTLICLKSLFLSQKLRFGFTLLLEAEFTSSFFN